MNVVVFGKKDCGLCQAAKDKLNRLGIAFVEKDIEHFTDYHEDWQKDGTVDVLASHAYINRKVPMITIDGRPYDYPGAMAWFKQNAATKTRS